MLEVRDILYAYGRSRPVIDGVSFAMGPGDIVGLGGRSGSGKSTLGRLLSGHLDPQQGSITIDGADLPSGGWSPIQYVHQSAIFAINPRWRIGRIVEEGWVPDEDTREALGIERGWYDRYPHELSGGELQRVALLRVLAPATRYLVADEVTAMLDPVAQAEIWRFLLTRSRAGLGIIAISHDEPLLRHTTSRCYDVEWGKLHPRTVAVRESEHPNHEEPIRRRA